MDKHPLAVIIMGSSADIGWAGRIEQELKNLGVESVIRVASAHKVPLYCLEVVKEYEKKAGVFITVAGRSNALSGFVDAQTHLPVIACPPYGEKYAGADLFSSISMPSGVAPMVVCDAGNAALAAAKILAGSDNRVLEKLKTQQEKLKDDIKKDDQEIKNGKR